MQIETIQSIKEEMSDSPASLKAEAVVALLLNSGIDLSDMETDFAGSFMRPFRRDIQQIKHKEIYTDDYLLNLELSRNGMYDYFPEGFVHTQESNHHTHQGTKQQSADYKKRKKETAEARLFFHPLENEIFNYRVHLEEKEMAYLSNMTGSFKSFFIDFWGLNKHQVPEPFLSELLSVMPQLHLIAGDMKEISGILSRFLSVPVDYRIFQEKKEIEPQKHHGAFGQLGQSFTAGAFLYNLPVVEFTIGPVQEEQIQQFLEGGVIFQFLTVFFEYTIPLEMDARIKITTFQEHHPETSNSLGIMGYSTII